MFLCERRDWARRAVIIFRVIAKLGSSPDQGSNPEEAFISGLRERDEVTNILEEQQCIT